ncbi:MAG TPA: hypothetical protein DGT21_08945 [Armatimonadetes bacterium]|jgi:hypothetical protein|nr:hypothetical protein [Armatimonadota bacterium]
MTWALVAAAALLLVVNMVALHIYSTTAGPPVGGPGVTGEINLTPVSYEAIQERYHAISNAVVPNGDHSPRGE